MELNEAYLIVEQPRVSEARYMDFGKAKDWLNNIKRLRESLSFTDSITYRGISRMPLDAFPTSDIQQLVEDGCWDMDINTSARLRMAKILEVDKENEYFDSSMLPTLENAIEIYNLLEADKKDDYEIIRIKKNPKLEAGATLGYDIGWWGGTCYSIICDCAIWPMWHPPAWDDLAELAKYLKSLNQYQLFDNIEQATTFRQWYRTKSWAEKEFREDGFGIIQIDKCDYQ